MNISLSLKPKLRGRIHQGAFFFTVALTIAYLICCMLQGGRLGVAIYLISQLILFGISSTYHVTKWKNDRTRILFRFLDHISIFLLISGTQTSVILTLIPISRYTKYILTTTWSISIAGILKILIMRRLGSLFDLVLYILHGVSIFPFFKIICDNVSKVDICLFICGGIIYLAGGVIFSLERPNPFPSTFGYHEVFHMLTVLANWCFMIPICKKYIVGLSV